MTNSPSVLLPSFGSTSLLFVRLGGFGFGNILAVLYACFKLSDDMHNPTLMPPMLTFNRGSSRNYAYIFKYQPISSRLKRLLYQIYPADQTVVQLKAFNTGILDLASQKQFAKYLDQFLKIPYSFANISAMPIRDCISVHLRLDDVTHLNPSVGFTGASPREYYHHALQHAIGMYGHLPIEIFSDSPPSHIKHFLGDANIKYSISKTKKHIYVDFTPFDLKSSHYIAIFSEFVVCLLCQSCYYYNSLKVYRLSS